MVYAKTKIASPKSGTATIDVSTSGRCWGTASRHVGRPAATKCSVSQSDAPLPAAILQPRRTKSVIARYSEHAAFMSKHCLHAVDISTGEEKCSTRKAKR